MAAAAEYQKLTPHIVGETIRYQKEGDFYETDGKKFFKYLFEIPSGTKEIQISFTYSPTHLKNLKKTKELIRAAYLEYTEGYTNEKEVDFDRLVSLCYQTEYPLSNILRLYIHTRDGENLGEWSPSSQVPSGCAWINEKGASRGLKAVKIKPGIWRVEICVGKIITLKCHFRLEIVLLKRAVHDTSADSLYEGFRDRIKTEEPTARQPRKSGWYAGQLHVHSTNSDGKNTVPELVEKFKEAGLDFFALTDHNTISGWKDIPRNDGLLVLKGIEIGALKGHGVGLGVKRQVDWKTDNGEIRDINAVIREVHEQTGLFALAHPYAIGDSVCNGCKWEYKELDYSHLDLLEVWFYPWKLRKIEAYRCFKLWNELLNMGLRVTGISSIDCHDVNNSFNFGPIPNIYVFVDALSENEVIEGLKKGHVFATSGPMISFSAHYNNKQFKCGDEIQKTTGTPVSFTVTFDKAVSGYTLKIIHNGNIDSIYNTFSSEKNTVNFTEKSVDSDLKPMTRNWYRCELYKNVEDEELVCFTNPIYITSGGHEDSR
ncbi:MAG: CehA/McbA family metallohydrolase [Spirochaetota bacterium]